MSKTKLHSEYDADTIAFYNDYAARFSESTARIDMSTVYARFLEHVAQGGRILDAGCGSGRDSLAFSQRGYDVVSMDASSGMVRATTVLTGKQALLMRFDEMTFEREFDGIWACASLLHVPNQGLSLTIERTMRALKISGILYCSFKYGDAERVKDRRLFSDQNEVSFARIISRLDNVEVIDVWVTNDARPDRQEHWLNTMVRRLEAGQQTKVINEPFGTNS